MTEVSLLIRPIQDGDEEAVIRLWHDCGLVVPHNDPAADIRLKREIQPDLFLVGISEGEIVATVMVGYDGHRGWINYLGVAPSMQRRGFGRRMMEAAEIELRQRGCPKINLQVRDTNQAVVDFYTRLGYEVEARVSMGKRMSESGVR